MRTCRILIIILLLGTILRSGLLLFFWGQPLTIVDELHYQAISENILKHQEFALKIGHPTSMRPPLYPAFLSAVYFLTGGIHPNAVRVVQILLSLGIIWMTYILGKRIFDQKTALLASLIFSVYPSFLFFTHFLLTEVLFTLFLLIFVYFFLSSLDSSRLEKEDYELNAQYPMPSSGKKSSLSIFLAGLFLGLSALTRSAMYPFLVVAILFLLVFGHGSVGNKIRCSLLLFVGYALIIGPWTVRNYGLYKELVVVGTMGGLNLYMGNYEHTPLNRAWAAVDLKGDKTWYHGHEKTLRGMNEAQKQKWAAGKAREFIIDHKLLTLKRSVIKAANFWGLERSVIGAIINGHWPQLERKFYLIGIACCIFSSYILVGFGAVFGLLSNLKIDEHRIICIITIMIYLTGIHTVIFGHSRYHLPLVPMLSVFASWSLMQYKSIWEQRGKWRMHLCALIIVLLTMIWIREIVFVEGARFVNATNAAK